MGVVIIELTPRQHKILDLAKEYGPITGEELAGHLSVTRAALRPDLAILTMAGLLDARPRVGYTYSGRNVSFLNSERIRTTKVKEVCSVPAVISEERSVYDAIVTIFLEDVGTLVVVDTDGYLAGVVSRSDLLKHSMGALDLEKIPVGVVMTRLANVVYATLDETVMQAARKLMSYRISSLPVVKPTEKDNKLEVVGVISQRIITKLFVELGEGH
ncbi:MAG: helix-turn-helix transcriptional regulator [Firmicutes bacterium]|nr:helix-turn-helix transcriptional regulator [Bacillota bacterium]